MREPVLFPDTVILDISLIIPNEWNPNEMTAAEYQLLLRNIRKSGMLAPVQVVPMPSGEYQLVGGEHRWRACVELGCSTIPAVILEDDKWRDEDERKFETMRQNIIHGEPDPAKMIALHEDLIERHSERMMAEMMGFSEKRQLDQLLASARETLRDAGFSTAAQKEFDKRAAELGIDQATAEKVGEILTDVMDKDMTKKPPHVTKPGHETTPFIVPLSNVLRTTTHTWRKRRAFWIQDMGSPQPQRQDQESLLYHDPVLAEIVYTWFCPKGGAILSPLGTNPAHETVAARLGRTYSDEYETDKELADLIFAALPSDDILETLKGVARSSKHLKQARFMAVIVPSMWSTDAIENPLATAIRQLESTGLTLYNLITCITGVSCPQATETFRTQRRLLPQTHQLLILLKGKTSDLLTALPMFDDLPTENSVAPESSTPPNPQR